jgi:hypothetical protein
VQRFERFLDRRFVVPAMDLVQVHVVRVETLEACIDLGHDRLARQAAAVGIVAHREVHFRGEYDFLAFREVAQRPPENFFALAVGVHIGDVEEVDAGFERALDERSARFLVQLPAALLDRIAHAAETDARDLETRLAEIRIFHRLYPPSDAQVAILTNL